MTERQHPPINVPSNQQPVIDPRTGILTPAWRAFFSDLVAAAHPIFEETAGSSPYVFTAVHPGALLIKGGFVTGVEFTRGRVTVDISQGSGIIGQASFKADKNGVDQTGIVSSVITNLSFPNAVWNKGDYYDAGTSLWTPPAGLVRLDAVARCTANVVDQSGYTARITKNGATISSFGIRASGTDSTSVSVSAYDEADGTDEYGVTFEGDGAGNKTISGTTTLTWFAGCSLGGGGTSGDGGFIPMSENDQVEITYTEAPELWYFPGGNPA